MTVEFNRVGTETRYTISIKEHNGPSKPLISGVLDPSRQPNLDFL